MSDIKDFVIEDGVLKKYTGNETEVVIPEGVEKIGDSAFYCCTNLTTINIPDSVMSIGISAFVGCTNLTIVNIPNSVTSIGDWAFSSCKKLTSITIPANLARIGGYTFLHCENLTTFIFPSDITTFKDSVIELLWNRCERDEDKLILLSSLLTQSFNLISNDADLSKKTKRNKKKIIEFAIKNDNIKCLENLFLLYKKIELDELNEYIEKSFEAISVKAFLLEYKNKLYTTEKQEKHENDNLEKDLGFKTRTVSEWKKILKMKNNGEEVLITGYKKFDSAIIIPEKIGKRLVTGIGGNAFSCCATLTTINIPDTVTSIGEEAFSGCENLTTINIPNSVTSISGSVFSCCSNLTTITIPESITSIDHHAFCNCKELTTMNIPDGVKSIGSCAFYGCENLTTINIPDSVTSIGDSAFSWCENLTICTPAESYAEKYAKENNIQFITE